MVRARSHVVPIHLLDGGIIRARPACCRANRDPGPTVLHGTAVLAVVVFLSTVVGLRSSAAESISVFGYPFQAERVESVDQNSVTLTVLGSTRLIKRADINDEIVATYLARTDLYSHVELEGFTLFLEEALKRDKIDWVATALDKALTTTTLSEKAVLDLIRRIGNNEEGVAALQRVVTQIGVDNIQAKGICAVLLALGKADIEWLRTKGVRLLFRYQMPCEAFFTEQYLASLSIGDLELANKVVSIYGSAYGVDGQGYRKVLTLSSKIDRMVDTLRNGEVAATARAISSLSSDPQFKDSANEIAAGLVERFVKVATTEQRYGDALELLTIRVTNGSSELTTAPYVIKILTEIASDPNSTSYILPPQVQVMLRAHAFKNDEVRQRYQAILERNIPGLLSTERFKEASILFDQVRTMRADPNAENDALRQKFVEAYLAIGDLEKAKRILSDFETSIPAGLRMRVIYESLRIGVVFLLMLCALAVLLAAMLAYRLITTRVAATTAKMKEIPDRHFGGQRPAGEAEVENEPLRKFVSASRAAGMKMPLDPYNETLTVFGLKAGATLQEIKVSYRNAVKECHPDLNPNASKAQTAKFIELTKAYERLVTLHSQRTGER